MQDRQHGQSPPGLNPWISLDFPDLRKAGGTRVEGPGFTAVSAKPGRYQAALAVECGSLGSARWTLPVVVLPAPDPDRPDGVSIEDGQDFVNSPRVRLWLGWEGLVDKVRVSNDGGFVLSEDQRDQAPRRWPPRLDPR